MQKIFKKHWWLILIFFGSFISLNFLGFIHNYCDPLNNYGFAYAIAKGEVPYLNFNTISTPLYAFITSIGLHIYNNYLTFLLEQSLLITICAFLLFKLFGKKSSILLIVTIITMYANIIATYNFMCFFMMILIIYMENKHKDKDYLIGILIALAVLSKQTVGLFLIIPSIIFYHNDIKKLKRRFLGFLIPCSIFLIYLLINKCLYQFLDLCLFGLFDFFNNNGIGVGAIYKKYLVFSILAVIIIFIMILKNRKDINLYYLIWGFFFTFPLFDSAHFSMLFNCLIISLLPYIKINEKLILNLSICTFLIGSFILFNIYPFQFVFNSKLKHFEYTINDVNEYKLLYETNKFINKYKDKKVVVVGYFSMKYSLYNDKDITYFDVLYRGNFGYNGTNKMINKIKKMHNCYFIVAEKEAKGKQKISQLDTTILNYIIENYKKIDYNKKYSYGVYYKK